MRYIILNLYNYQTVDRLHMRVLQNCLKIGNLTVLVQNIIAALFEIEINYHRNYKYSEFDMLLLPKKGQLNSKRNRFRYEILNLLITSSFYIYFLLTFGPLEN